MKRAAEKVMREKTRKRDRCGESFPEMNRIGQWGLGRRVESKKRVWQA